MIRWKLSPESSSPVAVNNTAKNSNQKRRASREKEKEKEKRSKENAYKHKSTPNRLLGRAESCPVLRYTRRKMNEACH